MQKIHLALFGQVLSVILILAQLKAAPHPPNVQGSAENPLAQHWGIKSIHLPKPSMLQKKTPHPIIVAIIDTGVDYNQVSLRENLFLPQGEVSEKNFGFDFSNGQKESSTPHDELGHGTHIAGIIKTIYPAVKLLIIKYYSPKASGIDNLKANIEAMKLAIKSHVDIINFSGGGPGSSADEQEVIKQAEKQEILIVVAAGNRQKNIDEEKNHFYPASYNTNNLITVSAIDQNMAPLYSSNWGKQSVDLSAPGDRIPSLSLNGKVMTLSGTSQATAYVTGVAAMLKSLYPQLTATGLKHIIVNSATKLDKLKKICQSGGVVNAQNALEYAEYLTAPTTATTLQNSAVLAL